MVNQRIAKFVTPMIILDGWVNVTAWMFWIIGEIIRRMPEMYIEPAPLEHCSFQTIHAKSVAGVYESCLDLGVISPS